MNKVEHTGRINEPLILNSNVKFSMDFDFDGIEADLLSILVTGKKSLIEGDTLSTYLNGIIEHLILESTAVESKREAAASAALKSGMSEKQIVSYFRGWDQVGERLEDDAANKLLDKASKRRLVAYQVGDNDVVAAYDEESARAVFFNYAGIEEGDICFDDYLEIEDLTRKLNVMLKDEEGNDLETLGDWMKRVDEPEYLYGWG